MDYVEVIEKLIKKGITISSCESLTGGLFASTISSIPGVSKIYKGSIISYATEVKVNLLSIPQTIVDQFGVVSYQVGYLMAKRAREILNTDMAISFTGNAGPSVMEGKEVGLVYIGICYLDDCESHEFHFNGTREEIRKKCVEEAFKLISLKIN